MNKRTADPVQPTPIEGKKEASGRIKSLPCFSIT
jgi:hypothetical protein